MTPETDRFHAHLDKCYQCREHPMDLCPTGAKLLTEAACSVSPIANTVRVDKPYSHGYTDADAGGPL